MRVLLAFMSGHTCVPDIHGGQRGHQNPATYCYSLCKVFSDDHFEITSTLCPSGLTSSSNTGKVPERQVCFSLCLLFFYFQSGTWCTVGPWGLYRGLSGRPLGPCHQHEEDNENIHKATAQNVKNLKISLFHFPVLLYCTHNALGVIIHRTCGTGGHIVIKLQCSDGSPIFSSADTPVKNMTVVIHARGSPTST